MSTELEGVKALLDAHLTNLRSELGRLATNYDSITRTVQSIENNTIYNINFISFNRLWIRGIYWSVARVVLV